MGTQYSAIKKREWLWTIVNAQGACGLGYDESKLIATFNMMNSSTRNTALAILKDFELTDKFIRKDGIVYSRQYFNPDLSIREEQFISGIPLTKIPENFDEAIDASMPDDHKIQEVNKE